MEAIDTSQHIEKLVEIAKFFDFPLENVESVPSIQDWCEERGIEENNPFRTGKCLRNRETGNFKILIAKVITSEMQNSVIGAMKFKGYGVEVEAIETPVLFLAHLLLHEVAHAKNENWSEKECDYWAFRELEKIAI